jgi:imidazolonepropionase-like amidohydrolase
MTMKFIAATLLLMFTFNCTTAQKVTIITNAHFINLRTGTVAKNATVLLRDNKDALLIASNKINNYKNASIINADNNYFMPALNDMHVHWPTENTDAFFNLCQKAGVTTMRIMKSAPEAISYKKQHPQLNLSVAFNIYSDRNITDAKTLVDSIVTAEFDFIKIFSIQSSEAFVALAKAAKNKLSLCGHMLNNVNIDTLIKYNYKSIEHVGYLDKQEGLQLDSAIEKFAKKKVAVCPTLDWQNMAYLAFNKDSFAYRAGYANGMEYYKLHWDTTYATTVKSMGADVDKYAKFAKSAIAKKLLVLHKLHKAGVNIIAGSDAEEPYQTPGYSIIEELKLIRQAGFSNLDLIRMVTTNAALYFANVVGANKNALSKHYILLSKNPLEGIDNLGSCVRVISN